MTRKKSVSPRTGDVLSVPSRCPPAAPGERQPGPGEGPGCAARAPRFLCPPPPRLRSYLPAEQPQSPLPASEQEDHVPTRFEFPCFNHAGKAGDFGAAKTFSTQPASPPPNVPRGQELSLAFLSVVLPTTSALDFSTGLIGKKALYRGYSLYKEWKGGVHRIGINIQTEERNQTLSQGSGVCTKKFPFPFTALPSIPAHPNPAVTK